MPPARDRQRVLRARHHRRVTTHDADAAVSCLAERAARGPEHTCTGNQFAGPRRTERQAKKRSRFRRRAARSHGMAPVRVPSCRRAMRTQLAAVGKTRRRGCRLAAGSHARRDRNMDSRGACHRVVDQPARTQHGSLPRCRGSSGFRSGRVATARDEHLGATRLALFRRGFLARWLALRAWALRGVM